MAVPGPVISLMANVWQDGDVLAALDRAMEERGYTALGMVLNVDPTTGELSTRYEAREYKGTLPVGMCDTGGVLRHGEQHAFRVLLHQLRLP